MQCFVIMVEVCSNLSQVNVAFGGLEDIRKKFSGPQVECFTLTHNHSLPPVDNLRCTHVCVCYVHMYMHTYSNTCAHVCAHVYAYILLYYCRVVACYIKG